jgi:predicted nucleic acid-binding protein
MTGRLLAALHGGGVTLFVSVPLLIEYEAVTTRLEHLNAAGLTAAEIGSLLDAVAAVADQVRLAFLWRPLLPDIDDDMVLETAVNGRVDGIVTRANIPEALRILDRAGVGQLPVIGELPDAAPKRTLVYAEFGCSVMFFDSTVEILGDLDHIAGHGWLRQFRDQM